MSEKRGSVMSRTQDLRNSEGRRPSMGMTYAELGERRDSINKEALAAAELYGGNDRSAFSAHFLFIRHVE